MMDKDLLLTPEEIEKIEKQVSEAHYHEDIRLSAKEYTEALPKAICQAQLSKCKPIIERQERERIMNIVYGVVDTYDWLSIEQALKGGE